MRKYVRTCILFISCLALVGAIYSCGGGGSSSGTAKGAGLYITDDLTLAYKQVIVTIYKVEFGKSSDGSRVTAFEDPLGITYDLRELHGVLEKLPDSSVPPGTYNRVYITVGKDIILVDNSGTTINTLFAENNWTTCDTQICVMEVTGAVNVIGSKPMIIDFDLKQFTYDPATGVTAKVVLDDDGADHEGYAESDDDDHELEGMVEGIDVINGTITLTVFMSKHFIPDSNTITVITTDTTVFLCDDDDESGTCTISSLADIQQGVKIEIHGTWNDPTQEFTALKIEVEGSDDGSDDSSEDD